MAILQPRHFKRWYIAVFAKLRRYLRGEAELVEMAANRLNLTGDEELREMARELGKVAERLRRICGE